MREGLEISERRAYGLVTDCARDATPSGGGVGRELGAQGTHDRSGASAEAARLPVYSRFSTS